MFFSDLHVQTFARGILEPGEQLLGQTVTSYMPWWAAGLIRRQYLVLATDKRLVLVDHRYGILMPLEQRLHQIDSIAWSNVQELKVKGLFMKKKLRVRGMGEFGPVNLTMVIPNGFFGLFAPMKNNIMGARTVEAALASAAGGPALLAPPSQGYGAPQISYAPPAPQLAAPPAPQLAASLPPQNAPGYASVPPPAAPYGAAPPPPPPPYGASPIPPPPPAPYGVASAPPAAPAGTAGHYPRSWS